MCGINGFWHHSPLDQAPAISILTAMNQKLHHRWPDAQGTWVSAKSKHTVWLAQVRLSIIDLSPAGQQPMWYTPTLGASNAPTQIHSDDAYCLTFNGEIYNYADIKDDLVSKWYVFSTHSDTEVILASYLERWTACVDHFNGFWAFALYDQTKQQLFCSRDRLGVKPFYYYSDGKQLVFSSELKGILAYPGLSLCTHENIDPEALDFYLTLGYIPAPWTVYRNIKKLPAGHHLLVSVDATWLTTSMQRYYEIPAYAPIDDKALLIQQGKQLLEESVKLRMFTSDVPVGAFLSGWLDSSCVVAEMTKWVEKSHLNTFSVGFEGAYDETPYINCVKNAFGTQHHHVYFQEHDFEEWLEKISFYYDEPFGDYSNFPTTFVSAIAKQHVTVSLSGDGGDEIFGGYMMHQVAVHMELLRKLPLWLRRLLSKLLPQPSDNLSLLAKLKEALRVTCLPAAQFYAEIGSTTLYKPPVYQQRSSEKLGYLLEKTQGNFVQAMIDYDLFYNSLADNFLTKVDRGSMSQALEVRSPFLDVRWIDWSRKVPTKWKVSWNHTKILMREIIKDIVPKAILTRWKKGFQPPIDKWILQDTYTHQLPQMLEKLATQLPLAPAWQEFYTTQVFTHNNTVFNAYKIKLLLLYKRYEMRFTPPSN